jgi:hypothetical protein
MLELLHGQFPLIQGVSGCLLYLFATVSLATQPSEATIEAPAESKIIEQVLP